MLSQPAFSVVIPTYNRAELVVRSVDSVLAQTFQDFEVLVVDDHSSQAFDADSQFAGEPRVTYIRRENNGGNAATRNTGVQHAKGEFVAFLDDDDEYLPQFLEKTYKALKDAPQSTGFSWCGTQRVRDTPLGEELLSEEAWQPIYESREEAYLSFLRSRRIGTDCGLTVRRSCFETVGLFDECLRKAVDTDFLIRIVRYFDFVSIPDILVKIHDHSGPRVRTNSASGAEAYERIIEKHADTLVENPQIWAAKHYKIAWLYYHAGNRAKARQHLQQALSIELVRPKFWAMWFMMEVLGPSGPRLHRQISTWKKNL